MNKTLMLPMALLFTTAAKAQLKVTDLRVEHMNNPTVVDETVPRFSWINEAMNEKARKTSDGISDRRSDI